MSYEVFVYGMAKKFCRTEALDTKKAMRGNSVGEYKRWEAHAMADAREETILMCGRDFTQEDLWVVRQTVRIFHRLSRHELAQTVCEPLEGYRQTGATS